MKMFSLRLLNRIHNLKAINKGSVRYLKRKVNFHKTRPIRASAGNSKLNRENEDFNEIDYEMEELESDFMDVHLTHKEHVNQMHTLHERDKFYLVRQKYFKEKYPNFLTWHDKEQMRYLHKTDPEEWTIERLSEGFPASPDVVTKIVKSDWSKSNENKIKNHDLAVQKNWKLFKEGKIENIPNQLKEHLQKFTTRELNFQKFKPPSQDDKVIVKVNKTNERSEFSDIISSYEKLKKPNTTSSLEITSGHDSILNNNIQEGQHSKSKQAQITLESLKEKIETKVTKGHKVSENDKFMLQELSSKKPQNEICEVIEIDDEKFPEISKQKFNAVSTYVKKTQRDVSHLTYPEKIFIPKKILKPGCTYKLNDCFYDHDGKFLYRVPGMAN